MNQYFEIPFRLPGLNEVIAANRRNPHAGAKLKHDTDDSIMRVICAARLKPVHLPCIVHMFFLEPNRRRDVDNIESAKKFILDALVKSGILQGDSPKYVIGAPSYTRYCKGGAEVRVTIIENEDEDYLRRKLSTSSEAITTEVEP